jgi:hypothetical protein
METKIHSEKDLKMAIYILELEKAKQRQAMHVHLEETAESLKPSNLAKTVFGIIVAGTEKYAYLTGITGILGSVILRKIISGRSNYILKRVFSSAAGLALTYWLSKKPKKKIGIG